MNLLKEVAEKVNRPFELKLAETRETIAHHFEEFGDRVAIAFSGGKDSEIVLFLCLLVAPNVPVVFNNTGVEYPETVKFVASLEEAWGLNLIVTHPEKSFWQCIEQYGFPRGTKYSRTRGAHPTAQCCYWLKEKPALLAIRQNHWLGQFTGISASESRNRMFLARDKGYCYHIKKGNFCKIHPILWWTESEVWQFIHDNGLPFNQAYLKGAERVGCMPCTAHKKWEEQMQRVNPKLYRMIKLRKDNQYVMTLDEG